MLMHGPIMGGPIMGLAEGSGGLILLSFEDELTLTEAWIGEFEPVLKDRLALSESSSGGLSMLLTVADALDIEDRINLAWVLILADEVGLADAATFTTGRLAAIADVLLLTGAAQSKVAALESIASALALEDMIRSGWQHSMADTVEFQAAWTEKLTAMVALTDAVLLESELTLAMRVSVVADDTIEFGETLASTLTLIESISDTIRFFASISLDGVEYSAWVLNPETAAPYEYRNFPFDSLVEFNGRHFGGNTVGLYELVGDTDAGEPIESWIRTGLSNLGSGKLKRMPSMYLGYKSDGTLALKVLTTSEDGAVVEDWYELAAQTANAPREGRIKLGRGLKSVYWGFELHNVAGADFALDVVALYPLILDRRI